jgi:hypothetical protein
MTGPIVDFVVSSIAWLQTEGVGRRYFTGYATFVSSLVTTQNKGKIFFDLNLMKIGRHSVFI